MVETQPALATTKRKFHKLVDSIAASTSTTSLASTLQTSNASTTSLTHPASPEPPNKRPRSSNSNMERDRSISASQARIQALKHQLLTPTRQGTVRVVGKATVSQPSTPRKPANFQPHSQEQFLGRVKTFADVKKWTTKPDTISEIEWAKRGWSCDAWNTVACRGGCEKRVAVKLRPKRKDMDGKAIEMSEDLALDVDDKLVERFAELIEKGHAEDSPDLPLLEHITVPDPSISDILQRIPTTLFKSPDSTVPLPSSPTDIVAFAFALFGWSGTSESRISLATCDFCFQRLGLWLSAAPRLQQMSEKLSIPISTLRLNLIESHREHCPWKNPSTQLNSPDGPIANMPAWQTLQFILLAKTKDPATSAHRTHAQNIESVDLGSEVEYPRGSIDSCRVDRDKEGDESLQNKWKKFKAKLRRTTSKKSLKSMRSTGTGAEKEG
ncbi:C3HC zinc finger-like-domain-containing protein [Phaeosphaeriaceae sp. PMI808]|nr:C3HC zinc finger-like-domain-containing protein [Phaeosphaeriaceae sp. PMI808]